MTSGQNAVHKRPWERKRHQMSNHPRRLEVHGRKRSAQRPATTHVAGWVRPWGRPKSQRPSIRVIHRAACRRQGRAAPNNGKVILDSVDVFTIGRLNQPGWPDRSRPDRYEPVRVLNIRRLQAGCRPAREPDRRAEQAGARLAPVSYGIWHEDHDAGIAGHGRPLGADVFRH
jgi:hypothetical protein